MKGLELSRAYFEEYGRPMLEEQFPALLPQLAAGLFGSGSECFGYDDEVSRDHDFEPGFCLFLPGEDVVNRRSEFLLERAYAKLPKSFLGFRREPLSPVGGARHGVLRTSEFFLKTVGTADGTLSAGQWLSLPEQALAEATNGALLFDNLGEVSRIREALRFFPEDIRRKRLAGQLLLMGQSGQYNFSRCLRHGESAAARLAAVEFVKAALSSLFLLFGRYQPYYKWSFRALRDIPEAAPIIPSLETMLTAGNESLIEQIALRIVGYLRAQGLSNLSGSELERHAYAVNDRIQDASIRNLHILSAT